MPPSG